MRKFSKVLRSIIELLYSGRYTSQIRRRIAFTLVKLELKSFFNSGKTKSEVTQQIEGLKVTAFNYTTLLVLFKEMFIVEEYNSAYNGSSPFIIDCGANIGMATLYFKWRFPDAVIHSFEPDPVTFKLLQKNIEQNGISNVTLHNKAVSTYNGTIVFYNDINNPGSLLMSTRSDRHPDNKTEVPCIKLAEFINTQNKIDIVKIDIEGAEFILFEDLAAENALVTVQEMFIEYHHKIGNEPSKFGKFLTIIEHAQFEYELNTSSTGLLKFQDVLIHCHK
jgi:FkbM family methyltransferase